jgi:A/G-specific adenine glycosylase
MLQQTRVETVIPYFQRWMVKFPDLSALSQAHLQEVLSLWEGLGYYSRARNLHKAACVMMNNHDGKIPDEYDQLIRFPGIGHSTAADILSVAFGQAIAAMDGNIKRVLARLFNITDMLDSPEFISTCQSQLANLLPTGRAGDFNQAMMDLGATICLPNNANCPECPLRTKCTAYKKGVQNNLPVKKMRKEIPHFFVTAGVIMDEKNQPGRVLLAKRPVNGLLGGLWEYPGGKMNPGESLEECLNRELAEELGIQIDIGRNIGIYKHAYTHFRVTLNAFFCQINQGTPTPLSADEITWAAFDELKNYPMGKLDRMISISLLESLANIKSE